MKLSVIVATRNRAESLARCLSSLLSQTRPPEEVVVVDNASADATRAVALSFAGRLHLVYCFEPEPDVARARNLGLARSSGDVVAFLDDDCTADPGWTESLLSLLCPGSGLTCAAAGGVARNGRPDRLLCRLWQSLYVFWFNAVNRLDSPASLYELPVSPCPVKTLMTNNIAYARGIFARVGLFRPDSGMNEDADFNYRLRRAGLNLYYSPAPGAVHYYRDTLLSLARAFFVSGRGVFLIRGENGKIRNSALELGPRGLLRFARGLCGLPVHLWRRGLKTDALAVLPFFVFRQTLCLAGYLCAALETFSVRGRSSGEAPSPCA